MEIFRDFVFDAAHRLDNLPEGHKCARVHGHTYRLTVHLAGPVGEQSGWILDFAEIKRRVEPVLSLIDHRMLNEVEGLEQPTVERIAMWLWERLSGPLPELVRITLREGVSSGCVYEGPGG